MLLSNERFIVNACCMLSDAVLRYLTTVSRY